MISRLSEDVPIVAKVPSFHLFTHRISTLKSLNRKFKVNSVRKPPPEHLASTFVAEVMTNNVSSRNGPSTVQRQIALKDGVKIPRYVSNNPPDAGVSNKLTFTGILFAESWLI